MIYLVERESVSSITLRKVIVNTSFNEVIIIELHLCHIDIVFTFLYFKAFCSLHSTDSPYSPSFSSF